MLASHNDSHFDVRRLSLCYVKFQSRDFREIKFRVFVPFKSCVIRREKINPDYIVKRLKILIFIFDTDTREIF